MTGFLIALILVSCFLITGSTGLQLAIYKEIAGLSVIGSLIIWWLWKYNRWLALFVGWIFLRAFIPPEQTRQMFTLFNVFGASVLYLGIQNLRIDKIKLFQGICLASTIQILVVFLQTLNLFMFWNVSELYGGLSGGRTWGLFGNSNYTGVFIAMTLPFFLEMSKVKRYYLWGLLGIPALIILDSEFALLAGISGVLFYIYMNYRNLLIRLKIPHVLLAILIIAILYISFNPVYFTQSHIIDRFETLRRTLTLTTFGSKMMWGCHFIQGFGLGSAYMILPKIGYTSSNCLWYQVHNEYAQVLLEFGFIGLFFLMGLVINTFRKFHIKNLVYYSALVAVLMDSLGFFLFRTQPMGFMAVVYLALIDKGD